MAVVWCYASRNAGAFLEAADCTGPGLEFAERIKRKCLSQRIEAHSWVWNKQRQAEATEQEMAATVKVLGPRWISLTLWNLAQSECTNTVCWLAEKVKDKVTSLSSESGRGSRGGARMARI